eukprot:snap_masked-scaffold_14-processed-gene-1.15-mRNA-1 protein AED:0.87 eAED:0.88 QI:0/0/0/0.5/1/1/2/0/465
MYFSSATSSIPFIPLGPRYDVQQALASYKYVSPTQRSPTNTERAQLLQHLETFSDQFTSSFYLYLTPKFSRESAEKANRYIRPSEYVKILFESHFTLCPLGHNPDTYRFYEALEAGSIPVVVTGSESYVEHGCQDSLHPLLSFMPDINPIVALKDWNELESFITDILSDQQKLEKLKKDLPVWRDLFWKDFGNQFNERLSELQNPKKVPLVTGCGRSGTMSVHAFLSQNGVKSVHEGFRADAISISWLYAAESIVYPFENEDSSMARTQLIKNFKMGQVFDPIYHIVRHPLKVISSTMRCFCGKGDRNRPLGKKSDAKSWKFVAQVENSNNYRHLFKNKTSDYPIGSVKKSALYWFNWNTLVMHNFPNATKFRIENVTIVELKSMFHFGSKRNLNAKDHLLNANFHTSANDIKSEDITWHQLCDEDINLAKGIFQMAQAFGYEESSIFSQICGLTSRNLMTTGRH